MYIFESGICRSNDLRHHIGSWINLSMIMPKKKDQTLTGLFIDRLRKLILLSDIGASAMARNRVRAFSLPIIIGSK